MDKVDWIFKRRSRNGLGMACRSLRCWIAPVIDRRTYLLLVLPTLLTILAFLRLVVIVNKSESRLSLVMRLTRFLGETS